MRFDLPEALGTIRTLRGLSSSSWESGPNESMFSSLMRCMSIASLSSFNRGRGPSQAGPTLGRGGSAPSPMASRVRSLTFPSPHVTQLCLWRWREEPEGWS